jgi:hypothetical protein
MKKSKKIMQSLFRTALLFLLAIPTFAMAQDQNMQSDQFENTYEVQKSTSIFFQNKIGDLKIETWDKQQVKLVVRYSIEAKNKKDLQELVSAIRNVKVDNSNERLDIDASFYESISTKKSNFLEKMVMKLGNGKTIDVKDYKIDYELTIPASNKLVLNSKYSNIKINDPLRGPELKIYDGNLEAGKLLGRVKLDLRYSDVNAGKFDELLLKSYDSNLEIGEVESLNLESKYSKIHIKKCGGLELQSYDDKIYFDQLAGIEGKAKYTTLVTSDLNLANMDVYDCSLDLGNIHQLQLISKYTRMSIGAVASNTNLQSYDDKISFKSLNNFKGQSKYTSYTIGNVTKSFVLNSHDDNISIANIEAGFDLIDLESKYSKLDMTVEKEAGYRLFIDSRYTGFEMDKAAFKQIIYKKESEKLEAEYLLIGTKGNTESKIKISSYDGKIYLK